MIVMICQKRVRDILYEKPTLHMQEYTFSLTRILPYKDKIYDSILIRDITVQPKLVFSHILCNVSIRVGSEVE